MNINIHIHHHATADGEMFRRLDYITSKIEMLMTAQERFDAAIEKLTTVAADIASDIATLKEAVANGTISDASFTALEEKLDALKAIGDGQ